MQAEKEFGTKVIIINKTSHAYLAISNPPPCPSVAVNNTFIVRDGVISYEDLKIAILGAR
jgi:hypothetical protein